MSGQADGAAAAAAVRRVGASREVGTTAMARALCYAAFSELTASPHDLDVQAAVGERLAGGREALPDALLALLEEFLATDIEALKLGYSGLFEVGSDGPPAPIREDLFAGGRAGTREDLIRFYDFFGYRLGEDFAWAPDHLSLELEFMHFLCYHEATDEEQRLSWQLGQADFAARHLVNWVPALAARVGELAPGGLYARVLAILADFVAADLGWQDSTISTTAGEAGDG